MQRKEHSHGAVPRSGSPTAPPHLPLPLLLSPGGLALLVDPFGELAVLGRSLPFPVPAPSHPLLQRPQQSLDTTLGVSCDLGKCLIQRDRLRTGKRRERKTLGCCSGSFLEQGWERASFPAASGCLTPDGGHTQHGFARRDKSARLTPPKTEESRWC